MARSLPRPRLTATVLLALALVLALLGPHAPQARAALPSLPLLTPAPAPHVVAPVQPPIAADPAGPAVGTMLIVHGGGWAGHDGVVQSQLLTARGDLFRDRGWRVVSVDYDEGPAGVQDVVDVAAAELARGTGDGPLCIYGESAGGHLALMAAARLRSIDCVIAVGAPTDLELYLEDAAGTGDPRVALVASQITRLFGTTAEATEPWNAVTLAPSIRGDVLLVREADDVLVGADHAQRFIAARPTTQFLQIEAGDPGDPASTFMHGTTSPAGRELYNATAAAFADRAIAGHRAELAARGAGCARVTRSVRETGADGLASALRCLARRAGSSLPASLRGWRQASFRVRGEVNAARLWAQLRATRNGRLALVATARGRARISVHSADRSRVLVRALRR